MASDEQGFFYFKYSEIEEGIEQYEINLDELYPTPSLRTAFEQRWEQFYPSDAANPYVFTRTTRGRLVYLSESVVPSIDTDKPKLTLVFGNPAPSSIKERSVFSFEGEGREHRVWSVFRAVGLMEFTNVRGLSNQEMNQIRKRQLFDLQYTSPFAISFIPFYSFPTTPSTYPWTGVAGMQKLFGKEAFRRITLAEQQRMRRFIQGFMPNGGAVIAFQKDAYNALRHPETAEYSRDAAVASELESVFPYQENITVIASAPTRLLHGKQSKDFLRAMIERFK